MIGRTSPEPTKPGRPPLRVLGLLAVVLVLGCTPLAVYSWRQAWADWHTVPSDGVVAEVRLVKLARTPSKAAGPWQVHWEVERDAGGRTVVRAPGSYASEAKAKVASLHDVGLRVTVWQVPGDDGPGRLDPPDERRGLIAVFWTTTMAAVGWLGVAGFVQRWLRRGRVRTISASV